MLFLTHSLFGVGTSLELVVAVFVAGSVRVRGR